MRVSERREVSGGEVEELLGGLGLQGREFRVVSGLQNWQELVLRVVTLQAEANLSKDESFSFEGCSPVDQFTREVNEHGFCPRIDPVLDRHFLRRELENLKVVVLPRQRQLDSMKHVVLIDEDHDLLYLVYLRQAEGTSTAEDSPFKFVGRAESGPWRKHDSDKKRWYLDKKEVLFSSESEGEQQILKLLPEPDDCELPCFGSSFRQTTDNYRLASTERYGSSRRFKSRLNLSRNVRQQPYQLPSASYGTSYYRNTHNSCFRCGSVLVQNCCFSCRRTPDSNWVKGRQVPLYSREQDHKRYSRLLDSSRVGECSRVAGPRTSIRLQSQERSSNWKSRRGHSYFST